MTPAGVLADFVRDPIGRYYYGKTFIVFQESPALLGFVSWGKPDVDVVRDLLAACAVGLRPDAAPHMFLADVRGLEFVDPLTFALFVDYVRTNASVLEHKLLRQAQIRPQGLVGAIISGFSAVARLPYPERVFDDPSEALAWLGVETGNAMALLEELDRIRLARLGSHPIVQQLRAVFEDRGVVSLAEAARLLATSSRTLQRALGEAGTTFRVEVRSFQLERARHLLCRDDKNLSWIATEVGFSSLQHFATAFRHATGETPGTFRARQRSVVDR